jgi:hypothetical protein
VYGLILLRRRVDRGGVWTDFAMQASGPGRCMDLFCYAGVWTAEVYGLVLLRKMWTAEVYGLILLRRRVDRGGVWIDFATEACGPRRCMD